MTGKTEKRLAELGIELPDAAAPAANYVPFMRDGDVLYVSGQLPRDDNGLITGRLGDTLTAEQGAAAARVCGLYLIAQLRAACGGDLDRLDQVLKLTGFVNSIAEFGDQPMVVNGASDLMVEVFGDAGRHARSAVSAASLPFGVAVEVEGIFRLK